MNSLHDIWQAVCKDLLENRGVSEAGFNMWLESIELLEIDSDKAILKISSEFHKKIVLNTYIEKIESSFCDILGFPVLAEIVVQNENGEATGAIEENASSGEYFTFDNFVVGSSNRFAHAAALAVAENPTVLYNPFLIYGNSGVGKTHLMLAIKNSIRKKFPSKKIEYIRCEDFTNLFIESVHNGTIDLFHNRFRTIDVLLIDDIQFIAGKESTQEEFFNTFNALHQEGKQIVLTSDRPPKDIKTLDERIRSRLESGLLSDIAPPDFETRVGIIMRKSSALNLKLNDEITYYIAEQLKANIRQIEGVVKKLQAFININKVEPTLSVVQNYIKSIINDTLPEPITVEKVISEVARTYMISEDDIKSNRRSADVAWGRQVAMYVAKQTTDFTNVAIGKKFNRDHTTVIHSVNVVNDRIKVDSYERKNIEDIIKNLKASQ